MRYVLIRDDDTNALTPVDFLERLYRPFLDLGLPVNLATIPNVRTDVTLPDGRREGFLLARKASDPLHAPIGSNPKLVGYLQENTGYEILQHGFHHEYFEFESHDRRRTAARLDDGTRMLMDAGFPRSETFVAPYDKVSRTSFEEVAKRFRILSTGWFELGRLPVAWWPRYALKKVFKQPHWKAGGIRLMSHPGCLLSYHRDYGAMLDKVRASVESRRITVLVTHWWEYFRDGRADEAFIDVLHETARYLAGDPGVRVLSFRQLLELD